jgi:hypothetical protein
MEVDLFLIMEVRAPPKKNKVPREFYPQKSKVSCEFLRNRNCFRDNIKSRVRYRAVSLSEISCGFFPPRAVQRLGHALGGRQCEAQVGSRFSRAREDAKNLAWGDRSVRA